MSRYAFRVEGDETNPDIRINHWSTPLGWPPHLHVQLELIYVRKGALEVQIDAQTKVLRKGCFGAAFPNCIHSYRHVEGAEDLDVWFYLVKPHLIGEYADKIRAYKPQKPFLEPQELSPDAHVALEMLKNQRGAVHLPVFKSYIQIVLACTWEQMHPVLNEDDNVDLPCQALRYMAGHFRQDITLESAAKELGVSKNHLSRVFSQKLHMHFSEYLHYLRMDMAKDLLCGTDQSVMTILYECGYESPRTFNRVFREAYGISPREYRQRYRSKTGK